MSMMMMMMMMQDETGRGWSDVLRRHGASQQPVSRGARLRLGGGHHQTRQLAASSACCGSVVGRQSRRSCARHRYNNFCDNNSVYSRHLFFFWGGGVKGKGSPYSITERKVPQLIPVLGSQPAGDVSHEPGGRLPLLSARPAVTPATLKRAATSFAAW